MSDKKWAQGSVASEDLDVSGDPTRCVILDGANLQPRRFVNQRFGADGTVYTQGFNTSGKGARFGLRFDFIPVELLQAIIAAVNAAVDAGESFNVALEDDFHTIDTDCTVDGSNWLSYPDQRTNSQTFKGVVMRFITT